MLIPSDTPVEIKLFLNNCSPSSISIDVESFPAFSLVSGTMATLFRFFL